MAKRKARATKLSAPTTDYSSPHGEVLTLRGSLTAPSRAQYARITSGEDLAPAGTREDAWHRAMEFLFERLVVRWSVAGTPIERQGELLKRLRVASGEERDWIRSVLREHCAEHFPDVKAP
ncbi:MAG: hypothetical protein ACRDK2_17385 [Solirubrobacteraceae bacterium]